MNTENLSTLIIHKLTQAQYDRELEAGNINPNALYLTPDEENYATVEQLSTKADEIHTHTKSQIIDFPASMPASDVSAWAKAPTKPSYTPDEIGAASITSVQNLTNEVALKAPMHAYSTTDLVAGTSPLTAGKLYFVYE